MKPILAFAGSNNPYSINHQLILAAAKKMPDKAVQVLTITDFAAPIYSECIEKATGVPESMQQLYQIFRDASGFVLASPEHNGLLPAFFKNTIDWLSRINQKFFGGKPVLIMSTSPGQNGGATNLRILTELLPYWGADVVSQYALPYFYNSFDIPSKTVTNPADEQKLSRAIDKFSQEVFKNCLIPIRH